MIIAIEKRSGTGSLLFGFAGGDEFLLDVICKII